MGLSPESRPRGAFRSLTLTGSLLAALLLAGALDVGFPSAVAKALVFPHAGFVGPHAFPDRPATALPFSVAVGVAVLQWGLVAAGLAWLTHRRSARVQAIASLLGVLMVGALVLGVALAVGGQIHL
ncbi:MAG TPA: hypothetical protein VJ505_16190 [Holophagaceae bacterium]|nr:hypothetical protein [Holophagaceae bacterium]